MGKYNYEIPKTNSRLEKSEEIELVETYKKTRDPGIFKELLKANQGIFRKLAFMHKEHGADIDELIICGQGKMEEAIFSFDSSRGARFSSYLWFVVKTEMNKSCARIQGITEECHKDMSSIRKAGIIHYGEHGRNPSIDELAGLCCITKNRVQNAMNNMKKAKAESLQKVVFSDGSGPVTVEDTILVEDGLECGIICRDIWEKVKRFIHDLTPRQQAVIQMRFGLETGGGEMTQQEIGDIFEVTKEAVRKMEIKALGELRRMLTVTPIL